MADYSEQDIRSLAVGFLRRHYRLRERYGSSGTRIVSRPHYYNGVKIDARFAYRKPDGAFFTATVEATSVDRAAEVLYRLNWWRIGAQALTLTLCTLAVAVWGSELFWTEAAAREGEVGWAGTQELRFNLFRELGYWRAWSLVGYAFLLLFGVSAALLSSLRRYRYIYAIAQFKRFHADDQWVAYDDRVFAGRRRTYHRELRRQATRYGFGLLRVLPGNEILAEINPSQIDQFGGQRRALPKWMAAIERAPDRVVRSLPAPRKFPGLPPRRPRPLPAPPPPPALPPPAETPPVVHRAQDYADPLTVTPYLSDPEPAAAARPALPPARRGRPAWYRRPARRLAHWRYLTRRAVRGLAPAETRRMPGFYQLRPWVLPLATVAALALAGGLYHQSRWSPLARPGQRTVAPGVAPLENARNPAPALPVEAGEFSPRRGPLPTDAAAADERYTDDVSLLPPDQDLIELTTEGAVGTDVQLYRIDEDGTTTVTYDCLPLYELGRAVYLLREGYYPDFRAARNRAEQLFRDYGLPVTVAQNACVDLARPGYLVYFFQPTDDEGRVNFFVRQITTTGELHATVVRIE